jgi:predicted RNA binding protein YcfA (HicA-like mRNA interferase family)
MKKTNQVKNYLMAEGFELIRHNKHMVYQNKEGLQLVVSHSSSDQYQLKQIQRSIRRIKASM